MMKSKYRLVQNNFRFRRPNLNVVGPTNVESKIGKTCNPNSVCIMSPCEPTIRFSCYSAIVGGVSINPLDVIPLLSHYFTSSIRMLCLVIYQDEILRWSCLPAIIDFFYRIKIPDGRRFSRWTKLSFPNWTGSLLTVNGYSEKNLS